MLRICKLLAIAIFLAAPLPIRAETAQPLAKGQKIEANSNILYNNGPSDQRGTEKSPLVVSLSPAPYHQTERIEDRESSKEQAATEKNLADYTWYLVLATIALVCVAAVQAWLFILGLKDTTAAAKAAAEQAEMSRRQYIASNRPVLRVRLVSIDEPVPNKPIVVRFEVVNVGGTRATGITVDVTLRIDIPTYAQKFNKLPSSIDQKKVIRFTRELAQGEALEASDSILNFDPAWGYRQEDGAWWANTLFVIGRIQYFDGNGVLRRTAFYRCATVDPNRFEFMSFTEAEKADHEYED